MHLQWFIVMFLHLFLNSKYSMGRMIGEISTKTTYQRTSNGAAVTSEVSSEKTTSEQNRTDVVEQVVNTQSSGGEMLSKVVGAYESLGDSKISMKTIFMRSSTGPIDVSNVSPEGKFVILENTSKGPTRTNVNLDGWKLKRTVDGKRDYVYNFRNFTLKAGKTVKIWARGSASEAGLHDLVFRDEDTWGVGSQVTTSLINDKNEEKASHVQKTMYN